MIFGKISPVLSLVKQDTLFNPTPEFTTGSFMTAVANKYDLGADNVNFRVSFGECVYVSGSIVDFKTVHAENITLDGDAIESWGTDDSVILNAIAELKEIEVTQVVSGSIQGFRF